MSARSIVVAIVFSCVPCLTSAAAERLTILHTNDVHGHLRPCSYPEVSTLGSGSLMAGHMQGGSLLADLTARRDIGGIARRATLAARIRADLAKQGTPVWLVDAGDFFYYSAFSNEYHGLADVIAMNRAGYDFATLGNHDFEITLPQLKRLIAEARFPFLCANVADSTTHQSLTKRYEVRTVGAARVGIFGLVTNSAAREPAASQDLKVEDAFAVAPAMVAQLRGPEKADVVILISHCGEPVDKELARQVPGIDVIVGSHTHTRLPQGEMVWWSEDLKPDEVGGTALVQTGEWGAELGRLDLLLERNAAGRWRVSRHRAHLIPVTSATPDDPAVAAVLDSLWAPHAAKYDEVLATATADFANRGDDLPQNSFHADAVRAEFGVEVEFEGTGGVHWPIVAGPVTRAGLVDVDQNRSTVVTFRMKGSEMRRVVERLRPVGSGLRYRMVFGKLEDITVGGAPLDEARVYSCAAGSSLVSRLDGFEMLDKRDTERLWSDVVIDAVRRAGTIRPAYDGRRVVIEAWRPVVRAE
jgi:2',3'-cyclic-nucleotide 2'-phosphodiesterase (5'-nucleotidase family)